MVLTNLKAYKPEPGVKIQVIGAGLPRTGTNSFCAALEILLKGPPYHLGVQTALSDSEDDVKTWIEVVNLKLRPHQGKDDRERMLQLMAKTLDGYAVTADPPLSQFVPELMELYPDAKVICTTRELESWADNMAFLTKTVNPTQLRFVFFWIKNLRYSALLWSMLGNVFVKTYGYDATSREGARVVWERHHQWLEAIVPKDKLFYVSVKDGWEPLCRALDLPVPEGVPFPRLNDGKAFEDIFKRLAIVGLIRWTIFLAVVALSMTGLVLWLKAR